MDLNDRAIALDGRFSHGVRDRLERGILAAGGSVARDLTRRSDVLVIGSLAVTLIDSGARLHVHDETLNSFYRGVLQHILTDMGAIRAA